MQRLPNTTLVAFCVLTNLLLGLGLPARGAEPAPGAKPNVSLSSLLGEMTDRDALARWPSPAYQSKQASSYDRAQTDPHDPKTWFANKDFEQFIRVEQNGPRKEWVIMEHEGPGCVTRIWVPLWEQRKNQVVRFYLDGSTKPAIEAKFNDLVSGLAFVHPPLAFVAWDTDDVRKQKFTAADPPKGLGGDLYLPIPFAKSCKITLDELPFYYCVNYRAYEPGTKVDSFSMEGFEVSKNVRDEAAAALLDGSHVRGNRGGLAGGELTLLCVPESNDRKCTIAVGGQASMELPVGSHAVKKLLISVDPKIDEQSLRSTVIQIESDGEKLVWCPIGEFFGCGVHPHPVKDWNREVTSDGNTIARWVMPYQKTCRVTFKNLGKKSVELDATATTDPYHWDERSMYFHADWRYQYPLATRPMSDWNYVQIDGQSVLVGDTLTVMSPSPAWYGEGDERIYVDGEKFPSHLGTGTEDYYGYAWGMADFFSSPFMSMPKREIANHDDWRGYTTTSRMRLLDCVPAAKSLKFDMEIWHWADCKVGYSAATFWYGRPGAHSNIAPAPELAAAELPSAIHKLAGAIECETMQIVKHSPDLKIETQRGGLSDGGWSGDGQLFVRATKPGDFVDLLVADGVKSAQRVKLYGTKSFDYGTLRFDLNGKTALASWDGWAAKPVLSEPIDLGVVEPQNGRIVLHVEVIGANPKATGPKHYLGLDAITLTPQ